MTMSDADAHNDSSHQSNGTWTESFPPDISPAFSFIIILAYGLTFLIGLFANIFVIVVIIKCRRMRTLTNRFLLNLAVSDLLATLICLPPTAYHHYDKRWIFGEFLCRIVPFIQGTSVAVSIFTLMAVSIDRFIAIHKPIHSKLLCTPTRILLTIAITWIASFTLMVPLIIHHRIVDPFDITYTACAEEWHQNMNARLAYDFLLLFLLFILPLTLMTYCYVRISFSLWFIDSNVRSSLSSLSTSTNAARFSTVSDDFPQLDINDFRQPSSHKNRAYYIHYQKNFESDAKRRADQPQQSQHQDEYRSLINQVPNRLLSSQPRRHTTVNDTKTRVSRRSSSLIGRQLGDNGHDPTVLNHLHQQHQHKKGRLQLMRHRHSSIPYTSGTIRSSLTSSQSHNRILGVPNLSVSGNHLHHRSIADFERASRFLQSRRRVVKLLITLVIVFFITRLPLNILSIYIDITSNTYLPDSTLRNTSKLEPADEAADLYSSHLMRSDKKMNLVLYVNPILQLMSLSNSAINPLCYCVMSHAVKHIFTVIRQRLRRRGQKKASASGVPQRPIALNQSMKIMAQQQARNSFGMEEAAH